MSTSATSSALHFAGLFPQRFYLEVQRADLTIKLTWPGALASECAAWLRESLR